jgi:hypothetical protein
VLTIDSPTSGSIVSPPIAVHFSNGPVLKAEIVPKPENIHISIPTDVEDGVVIISGTIPAGEYLITLFPQQKAQTASVTVEVR